MAVLPECQRQGVGSQLVRAGLDSCRASRHDAIVVIGHPEFYPRFGFVPAVTKGLRCEFDVPPEVFMVLELRTGALDSSAGGFVKYRPEFSAFE
jgi:putative acetyltransferase